MAETTSVDEEIVLLRDATQHLLAKARVFRDALELIASRKCREGGRCRTVPRDALMCPSCVARKALGR